MKNLYSLLLSISFVFFSNQIHAGFFTDNSSINYSQCTGNVSVKFPVHVDQAVDCATDDQLWWIKVWAVRPDDTEQYLGILEWNSNAGSCFSNEFHPINSLGCRGYYHCGDNNSVIQTTVGSTTFIELTYTDMEDVFFGNLTKIRIEGFWDYIPGGGENFDHILTGALQQSIGSPTIQTISTDSCAFRRVRWTNQNGTVSCDDIKKFTVVQRKPGGALESAYLDVKTVAFPTDEWDDNVGESGEEFDYRVYHSFIPNGVRRNDSGPSSSRTGRKRVLPSPPTGLTATRDRCDGAIELRWVNPGNIGNTQYDIYRSYSGQANGIIKTIIDPTVSFWLHEIAPDNVDITYTIITRSVDCTTSSAASAAVIGFNPGTPSAPTIVNAQVSGNNIIVSWNDISNDETAFIIERTFSGGGGALIEERPPGTTSWPDMNTNECVTYTYTVKAKTMCFPDGNGDVSASTKRTPDLTGTFDPNTGLRGSKGYFTDKVELTWTNLNLGSTNQTSIYRRVLGSGQDSSLLVTLNGGSGIYNDIFAEAGILYEYFVVAEGQCENFPIQSNVVSTIGFRQKSGQVSGKVTYEGGVAVQNVKIVAESSNALASKSIEISGGKLSITDQDNQDVSDQLIVESWIKPMSYSNSFDIAHRPGSYRLLYNNTDWNYKFQIFMGGNQAVISVHRDSIGTGQWTHIVGQLRNDSLSIYINGKKVADTPSFTSAMLNNPDVDISILEGYDGFAKELRIWKTSKSDDDIFRDHSRFINSNATDLVIYLPFSEGIGEYAYDRSLSGPAIFNRNHAMFMGTVAWSNDVPTLSQLSYAAYTDDKGDYILTLPYTNAGENYTLTPIFPDHEFEPNTKLLFIGDGSSVLNGIDFKDVSSFPVTGTLFYEGTTCPVKDAFFEIDGNPVTLPSGQFVKTRVDGGFDLDVPIGDHYIEVMKNGHTFSDGRWPSDPSKLYDFQEPLTGIPFKDSTKIILVGRATGGTVEEAKKPGMGRSNNNIGIAKVTLRNTMDCGWITDSLNNVYRRDTTFFTDSLTGEYLRGLIPMQFTVAVELKNDATAIDFGSFEPIDLRQEIELGVTQNLVTEIDTAYIPNTVSIRSIDSIKYHKEVQFIYRSKPSIDVMNLKDEPFIGEEEVIFTHTKFPSDTINLNLNPLLFPVFTQNKRYESIINVFEEYTNIDNLVAERVPVVKGNLVINNELSTQNNIEIDLEANDTLQGKIPYAFFAGEPSLLQNLVDVPYSFTKTFQIKVEDGNLEHPWLPFEYAANLDDTPSNESFYRGYIFGAKPRDGTNFVTQGPSIVRYILRDPPGGESFATLAESTTVSNTHSWSVNIGADAALNTVTKAGIKTTTGIGFLTENKLIIDNTQEFSFGASLGTSGEYSRSTTSSDTYSTSSIPNNVGAGSDLFMGQSNNYNFGLSDELGIFPATACIENAVVECFGNTVDGFRIGTNNRMYVAPGEVKTTFFLTQTDIINYEIPNLIALRNDRLNNDGKYNSILLPDNPNYGKNNDNFGAFGSDTTRSSLPSAMPPSYTFSDPDSIDQVRTFNEQIRLWEEALGLNEKDKLEAIQVENFTFDGGGSSFERTFTSDTSNTHTWSFEARFSQKLKQIFSVTMNGAGFELENTLTFNETIGYGGNNQQSNSVTTGYTLTDGDIWDRYSVDVQESSRAFSPVFKINAGETSCPHEPALISRYYEPGTTIASGTLQLEQPSLLIDGLKHSKKINVPEDEAAEFVFRLGNNSTQGWAYSLGLLNHTNPGGAIIVNSGTSELGTAPFTIGAGLETQQRIIVEKGGAFEHDSLLFVFHSTCQYDQGNDFDADIGDSAYVSVHFIPGCSDITIHRPDNQWILNKSFNDKMPIIISDYDVNTNNFEKFIIEYKPSNEATWNVLHTYYKDTSGITGNNFSQISNTSTSTTYLWDVLPLSDGDYDLRATTDCDIATEESAIHSGYMDRQTIEVFGTPSPADGILDPNDDILLTMNETIDEGGVTSLNFDVRGVLNGTELRHETSVAFDGINSYAEIPEYQLQERSMTIEFWLKRSGTGAEVILSQGPPNQDPLLSNQDLLRVAFTPADKLQFQLGNKVLTSGGSVSDDKWHHYAISYDRKNLDAEIFIDFTRDVTNNSFGTDYNSTGPIMVGKDVTNGVPLFEGFMHELRLWSIPRSEAEVAAKALVTMSGRESGLIGNWPMDEAYNMVANDKVRSRHAQLNNTTWSILPKNHSFYFEGDSSYLEALNAGTLAFNEETDITLEAWFKTGSNKKQSLFSNGIANGFTNEDFAWDIHIDQNGAIIFLNDGNMVASTGGLNDNNWHHVAAVIERTRAVSIYIDGQLVQTGNASDFKGFAGPRVWVGARGRFEGSQDSVDQFFNGFLDEIRIWNSARQPEQIGRDFVNQLVGDEFGLQTYYPFDGVTSDLGIFIREADLKDGSLNNYNLSLGGKTVENFDEDAPPIKLPRLIEQVNFTYSINNDQIFIEITDPPARVENVTLDITVRGLKDLAGNFMQSPETWIAYIDKNQVFWETEYFSFEKNLEDPLSFTAKIKNTGGSQEAFNLGNIPTWLTASPSAGLIDPNTTVEVNFTVQPLLNIGEYEQDIFVTTESFGFNERLLIDLKVSVNPPDWVVNPDDFSTSMNITGQFKINDVISTDLEDMVSVWVNDELRGLTHVEFDPSSGKHLVFLTVMSNADNISPPPVENLEFRAWDASRGRLLIGLLPDTINFTSNHIRGSRTTPVPIEATVLTELIYVLNEGWNWISFPLASTQLASAPGPIGQISPDEGDQIKSNRNGGEFLTRDMGIWDGSLTSYNTLEAYKVKVAQADTFRYSGTFMDPSTEPISLITGWNWISVKSEFIIDVPSAMASLDPKTGDVLKGQRSFAIYEDGFGWGGNLDFLEPQKGYMLKYHSPDQLTFPGNLNLRPNNQAVVKSRAEEYRLKKIYKSVGFVPGTYGTNMSLTAKVDQCLLLANADETVNLIEWQLAAFVGQECRGIIDAKWENSMNTYLYYLSIEGDQSTDLNFKLIHISNGKTIEIGETLEYENNGFRGIPSNPVLFSCTGQADCVETLTYGTSDLDLSRSNIVQQARLSLQSDAQLPAGIQLLLRAGNEVQIMRDFEVSPHAALEVRIEDCKISNQ